jgi:hypothetical protein
MNAARMRGRLTTAAIASIGCLLGLAAFASAARAQFAISEFGGATELEGAVSRQAGAHVDLVTVLRFNELGGRTAIVNLPPGITANPTSASTCTQEQLIEGTSGRLPRCPVSSQVGRVEAFGVGEAPVYNMQRPSRLPGLLAFNIAGTVVKIEPHVRSSDYGISTTTRGISEALSFVGVWLKLWGVPSDPIHDPERFTFGAGTLGASSEAPLAPYLTSPASCSGTASITTAEADSWWEPGLFSHASFSSDLEGNPFITEGCGRLHFEPSVAMRPDSNQAAGPTGLNVDIKVPQNESPHGLATPQVRKVVTTLPKGFVVSPSVAHGLGACSLAEIKLGSEEEPQCPASATIGTVAIKTPLLDEELDGEVIVARQRENPFGSLLALYLVVRGPGILLKLPGRVDLDPQNGQVTATFADTPQLPFEELQLSLYGGPTAPLQAPNACGTYNTHVEMTSWASSTPVQLDTPMTITEGCNTGGFNPGLKAGTANPTAGSTTAFNLQLTRNDGEQNISGIEATLPEGVLAKLKGVPLCPEEQAATGACPAASQVGTTTVGAGAGSNPIYVPEAGKAPTAVYLAGPYKGAPYSLVVVVPAQAGPFDLGTVTVRNALEVDPATTQVTAKSDPLPQILEGIPLTYRDIRIEINRNDFGINPTNCEPMKVTSTILSAEGKSATPSARFQVADCEALAFRPKLALALKGQTKRTGNPALTATLTAPAGEANIAGTSVLLPKSEFIDNSHINNPCTRVQFNANACPPESILGTAVAYTPLLDKPLEGPVYFRSNGGERQLPDLVVDLNGQIHVTLVGFIDSVHVKGTEGSRVRTRFASVPDAPVSKFVLKLYGGKRGLLENSLNLCKGVGKVGVKMTGQNGKLNDFETALKTSCKKKPKPHRERKGSKST